MYQRFILTTSQRAISGAVSGAVENRRFLSLSDFGVGENLVIIGNQADPSSKPTCGEASDQTPASDFKGNKRKKGYRYANTKRNIKYPRHFLEAGLKQALDLKTNHTEGLEETTIIVFKGNYTDNEITEYQQRAMSKDINFLVAENNSQIVNYINKKEFETVVLGDLLDNKRLDCPITDFTYVGHGEPRAIWTGHACDDSYISTTELETEAFSSSCNVTLLGCGQGIEKEDNIQNLKGTLLFDDFQDRIIGEQGTIKGYRVTLQWGGKGLGSFAPFHQGYLLLQDRNRFTRNIVPLKDRKRVEHGHAKR